MQYIARKGFTARNSNPHEHKISTSNMTAKGTHNTAQYVEAHMPPLRYNYEELGDDQREVSLTFVK